MRLNHFEIFHAVLLCGSASGAAKLLNLSQPAVSRLLQSAEMQLGFKLFERTRNRLIPTQEALRLQPEVELLLNQLSHLRQLSKDCVKGAGGVVRISCVPSLAAVVLPKAVARFIERYPKVDCRFETQDYDAMIQRLVARQADVGLTFESTPHPAIDEKPLAQGRVVCASKPGTFTRKKSSVSWADLSKCRVIELPPTDLVGRLILQACQQERINQQSKLTVDTNYLSLLLAAQGAGVAVVDSITASQSLAFKLEVREVEPLLPVNVKALTLVNATASAHVKAFVTMFGEVAKALNVTVA